MCLQVAFDSVDRIENYKDRRGKMEWKDKEWKRKKCSI